MIASGSCCGGCRHLGILRKDRDVDGCPAIHCRRRHDHDHWGLLPAPPVPHPRVGERDLLVLRRAQEAPLSIATAALRVWVKEAVGELHSPVQPAVKDRSFGNHRNACDLLHCACEDRYRRREAISVLLEVFVACFWKPTKKAIIQVELRKAFVMIRRKWAPLLVI